MNCYLLFHVLKTTVNSDSYNSINRFSYTVDQSGSHGPIVEMKNQDTVEYDDNNIFEHVIKMGCIVSTSVATYQNKRNMLQERIQNKYVLLHHQLHNYVTRAVNA